MRFICPHLNFWMRDDSIYSGCLIYIYKGVLQFDSPLVLPLCKLPCQSTHSWNFFCCCRGGQECRASFNDCVCWTFAPAYHFTWKGPILIMKVNSSNGRVADCTEMDLKDVREIIKTYVPTYFHMLIA